MKFICLIFVVLLIGCNNKLKEINFNDITSSCIAKNNKIAFKKYKKIYHTRNVENLCVFTNFTMNLDFDKINYENSSDSHFINSLSALVNKKNITRYGWEISSIDYEKVQFIGANSNKKMVSFFDDHEKELLKGFSKNDCCQNCFIFYINTMDILYSFFVINSQEVFVSNSLNNEIFELSKFIEMLKNNQINRMYKNLK